MKVRRFAGEYAALAMLTDRTVADLMAADATRSPVRFMAWQNHECVAAVTAHPRPDRRILLRFVGPPPVPFQPLAAAVSDELPGKPIAVVPAGSGAHRGLQRSGFVPEVVTENFAVSIDVALRRIGRVRLPARFELIEPGETDEHTHLALDDEVRNDVPGTDGWRGDLAALRSSLEDDATYLIARSRDDGTLCGLFRMWHNDTGSHLGLVAVTLEHRGGLLGPALVAEGLRRAAERGTETFTAGVAVTNRAVYAPLLRLGTKSLGRSVQLVYAPSSEVA